MLTKIFDFFRNNSPTQEIRVVPIIEERSLPVVEHLNSPEPSGIRPYKRKNSEVKKEINDLQEYIKEYKEYCLEKTSNQHLLKVPGYSILDKDDGMESLRIYGDGFIFHHEHHTVRIESEYFVKYIQQEYNPITKLTENAYD